MQLPGDLADSRILGEHGKTGTLRFGTTIRIAPALEERAVSGMGGTTPRGLGRIPAGIAAPWVLATSDSL